MSNVYSIVLLLLVIACGSCTRDAQPLAGGSSQQGNGRMVGCVVTEDGSPAAHAHIRVRPSAYLQQPQGVADSISIFDTVTDCRGTFTIDGISPGRYSVEANDGGSSAALEMATISEQKDSVDLGIVNMKPYAGLHGTCSDSTIPAGSTLYVQVRGLERLLSIDAGDTFFLDDLPEGTFDLRIVNVDSPHLTMEYQGIYVGADDTTSVVLDMQWSYTRKIRLNTAKTGAHITSDITNFPVLIRLDENTFNFDQANDNGSDIRFFKSDNTSLPFEIERWDPFDQRAEVWVGVDTIYGDDSAQSITMQWGNSRVENSSSPSGVFDTTYGFAGVWHLGENGDSAYDATENRYHGVDSGATTQSGIIGNARGFTSGQHVRIPGLLDSLSAVTLSAWVRSDESASSQEIISIGDAVLIRLNDINEGTAGSFHSDSVEDIMAYTPAGSGQTLAQSGWHFVAYTIDPENSTQTLYIDGVESATTGEVSPIVYAAIGSDTYIGKHGNGKPIFNFVGQIDEVRVNDCAVSSDWIKLCYENQKENGAFVVW